MALFNQLSPAVDICQGQTGQDPRASVLEPEPLVFPLRAQVAKGRESC